MTGPSGRVAQLCRHPVKAIGHEELGEVRLAPGLPLPGDRAWAVAHAAAALPEGGGWAAKMNFLRGVAAPELMAIRAETLPDGRLALHHPRAGTLRFSPEAEGDRLLAWLAPLWPEGRPAPAQLVRAPETGLADTPGPNVAVLSMASLEALGRRLGRALSIHRFRGNVWLEGLAPWAEFDLVGRRLRLGEAELRVHARITRCRATSANPETGRFDAEIPEALEAGWGHADFGVYAEVVAGGTVRRGDPAEVMA